MNTKAPRWMCLLSMALLVAFLAPQRAAADDERDPSSRVARVSYANGPVSFEPAGTDDWVDAIVNRPVTTGDKLWTDGGARAELQLGSATVHLAGSTGFSFLNLSDNVTQIRLTEGTVRVRVRHLDEDETFEIDTPNLAFSVLRPGRYRVSVNENGDTSVISVLDGQGEVTGAESAYNVQAGETATFSGTDQLSVDVAGLERPDDFDDWCLERDRREDRSVSSRYVDTYVVGYSDLDDYGGWRTVPEYGTIWFPHVTVVGWAPYRYGHWAWISPWGWTWVDDEPWGFAPFHYGRWVVVGGVWGWVPCRPQPVYATVAYVRPVYAPALVAWVGGGFGVSVGWFPLGPREVYVPSYPVSRTYINNVNISNTTVNTTVINNYYNNTVVNKNVHVTNVNYVNRGAVTAMTPAAFTSARPVAQNMVRVNARQIENAPVAVRGPAIAPTQQSVAGAGRPVAASARPPQALANRAVVAKTAPPPAPVPFAKQQQAIQSNGGRPVTATEARQLERQNESASRPNVRVAAPGRTVTPLTPGMNRGMSHGDEPANQAASSNRPGNAGPGNAARGDRPNNAMNENRGNANAGGAPVNNPNRADRPMMNPSNAPANNRSFNDRPPAARPLDTPVDRRQAQQEERLHQQQDQERQGLERQQQQENQRLQRSNPGEQRRQQVQQQQERQLQRMEQRHGQQQQTLEREMQQERARSEPKPEPRPKQQQESREHEDRPNHR